MTRFFAVLDIENADSLDLSDVAVVALRDRTPGGRKVDPTVYASLDDLMADHAGGQGAFLRPPDPDAASPYDDGIEALDFEAFP